MGPTTRNVGKARAGPLFVCVWLALAGCSEEPGTPPRKAFGSPSDSSESSASTGPSPSAGLPRLPSGPSSRLRLELIEEISGYISPKSIVASQDGLFFAQNMMYKHTISVYDREFQLLKTIPDEVELSDFGYANYTGVQQGAPVEAAFAPDGDFAYVSQYSMYGPGFANPGTDSCTPSSAIDDSFVYRVRLDTLSVDRVIAVGRVPKYVAVSPDNRYVLVTNWCSYDLSVIDVEKQKEIERIPLGEYPRGIAVDASSETAYIALFGGTDIAKVDLSTFGVEWIRGVGLAPRHINIDPDDRYLYATLNNEGTVAKIDLETDEVVEKVETGNEPRSMAISADGKSLYVVNYESSTLAKVRTSDMTVVQTVPTSYHPIGITHDGPSGQVWVACYGGTIMVFQDGVPTD